MVSSRVVERVVACHDSTWTYQCAGEGPPPVLWLHGLWGEPAWESHHQRLAEQYTIYAPALPGYQGSSFPEWMVDCEDAATLVIDFLETLTLGAPSLLGIRWEGGLPPRWRSSGPPVSRVWCSSIR